MRPAITILTDPIPYGIYGVTEFAISLLRSLKRAFNPLPPYMQSKFRGHFAVTRSVVEGLRKIGADANYNPRSLQEVAEVVVVLSGVRALKQALALKRSGLVKTVLAGPNITVFPSEIEEIICSLDVDKCVVPADWVVDMYEADCPSLKGRCVIWPAGVDTEYWKPSPGVRDPRRVLVYEKQVKSPVGPIDPYVAILEGRGYLVKLIQYGSYRADEYLRELQQSSLMIGFVSDESQGLAWAEAWSSDVPLLCWYQDHDVYKGRRFRSSTAPYLSSATGRFFDSLDRFQAALDDWEAGRTAFHPRMWVLENMSDEVCARKLLALAGVGVPNTCFNRI
jgi:hypothetical protein